MTGSEKSKGDRAEREAAELLAGLLGVEVRRHLGAGRKDDVGDLDLPGWTVQVADWTAVASALRVKPLDADRQAARSGTRGIALLRLRGGEFRVAMTPESWALLVAELAEGWEAIDRLEAEEEPPHAHRWGINGICPDCGIQHGVEPW